MNNDIDNKLMAQLSQRLAEAESPLPEGLWERIEDGVDAKTTIPAWRKPAWRAAAAVAVLLACVGTAVLLHHGHTISEPAISDSEIADADSDRAIADADGVSYDIFDADLAHSYIASADNSVAIVDLDRVAHDVNEGKDDCIAISVDNDLDMVGGGAANPTTENGKIQTEQHQQYEQNAQLEQQIDRTPYYKPYEPIAQQLSRRNNGSLAMGVFTNMSPIGEVSKNPSSVVPSRSEGVHTASHIPTLDRWERTMPVTVGLSLRYKLTDRLGIETGLSYTYLKQNREIWYSDQMQVTDESKVHYLGIPLKLSYRWFSLDRVNFYTSMGGAVQRIVSISNSLKAGNTDLEDHLDREQKGTQWTATAALGAEYQISERLGLYAEPGMTYFFKEKNSRPSLYKARSLNFSVDAGLRFTF